MLGNGSRASRVRPRALGPLQVSQKRSVRAGVAEDSHRKNPKVCPSRDAAGDCEAVETCGRAVSFGPHGLRKAPPVLNRTHADFPAEMMPQCRGCAKARPRCDEINGERRALE